MELFLKNNIPIFSIGIVVSPKNPAVSGILTIIVCIHKVNIIEIIKNLLLFPDILNIDILSLLQLKI